MTRVLSLLSIVALTCACPGDPDGGMPVGSEGGPCTSGGGCDPGLVCLSDLCVRPAEGEGECLGDTPSLYDLTDCEGMPTAACGPVDENLVLATCRDAFLILRPGLFSAAFPCLDAIPSSQCASADDELAACFGALEACANPAAANLCQQAFDTCVSEGQSDFPREACNGDLTPTNTGFRTAYADCFNDAATEPCASVHDFCYGVALATLIEATR